MINLDWSGYKKITAESTGDFPIFAGVYKLATYDPNTEKYNTPFYVGQADNIKSRTQQHASSSEKNSCIKGKFDKYNVYVNYAAVSRQEDRNAAEVALYNHYKSACNDPDALPDVEPADVSSFN